MLTEIHAALARLDEAIIANEAERERFTAEIREQSRQFDELMARKRRGE